MKKILIKLSTLLFLITVGCSSDRPYTNGAVGGAGVGAGVGALVARASAQQATASTGIASVVGGTAKGMSIAKGMAVGAAIGVPAGVVLVYAVNSISGRGGDRNAREIEDNHELILENQRELDRMRGKISQDY